MRDLEFFVSVYDSAKILIWKQITTQADKAESDVKCIWLCKDTNLKANHNEKYIIWHVVQSVYDSAKILIWKQITTQADKAESDVKVYMTLQRY